MNKHQSEGKAKDVGGKIKEEAGDLIGDREMKRKGQKEQAEGKLQKGFGDIKETLKEDQERKERP